MNAVRLTGKTNGANVKAPGLVLCTAMIIALLPGAPAVHGAPSVSLLPGPVESDHFGRLRTVSADGLIEVGSRPFGTGMPVEPYRVDKSPTGNITRLGALPGAAGLPGYAYGVSADGRVVVGQSGQFFAPTQGTEQYGRAFRWTFGGGMQDLGELPVVLPTLPYTEAFATSGDGSIVVGHADVRIRRLIQDPADPAHPYYDPPFNVQRAFIWDGEHGMRSLNDAMWQDFQFSPGLTFISATAISDDGGRIAGQAINGAGLSVWFELEVPEPGIAVFGARVMAVTTLATRRPLARRPLKSASIP
jgi:probable HAF family extracellular repeat protein